MVNNLVVDKHLRVIADDLKGQKAVLFVGAGFSKNAIKRDQLSNTSEFLNWGEFVQRLASRLWPDSQMLDERSRDYLHVVELYKQEFGESNFYSELEKAIPDDQFIPSVLHQEVLNLPWADIITTNQDTLLERTLEQLGQFYDVIVDDLDIPLKHRRKRIYKIHGTISRPQSIIFSEEDYRCYEIKHPLMHVKVKDLFAESTVVFVGFSLSDPNFKNIHGWVRDVLDGRFQRVAYALVFDSDCDDLNIAYWRKRGIVLIPISVAKYQKVSDSFSNIFSTLKHLIVTNYDEAFGPSNLQQDYHLIDSFIEKYINFKWDILDGNLIAQFHDDIFDLGHFEDYNLNIDRKRSMEQIGRAIIVSIVNDMSLLKKMYEVVVRISKALTSLKVVFSPTILNQMIQVYEINTEEKLCLADDYGELKIHSLIMMLNGFDIDGVLTQTETLQLYGMSDSRVNDILYLRAVAAKYAARDDIVVSCMSDIKKNISSPTDLNRIAALNFHLGNLDEAQSTLKQAMVLAKKSNDMVSLWVSICSSLYLAERYNRDLNLTRQLENEIGSLILEPNVSRVQQGIDRRKDDISKDWNSYKLWSVEVKNGYNSRKEDVPQECLELIFEVEQMGLFINIIDIGDVVIEACIENGWWKAAVLMTMALGPVSKSSAYERLRHIIPSTDITTIQGILTTQLEQYENQQLHRCMEYRILGLFRIINCILPISDDAFLLSLLDEGIPFLKKMNRQIKGILRFNDFLLETLKQAITYIAHLDSFDLYRLMADLVGHPELLEAMTEAALDGRTKTNIDGVERIKALVSLKRFRLIACFIENSMISPELLPIVEEYFHTLETSDKLSIYSQVRETFPNIISVEEIDESAKEFLNELNPGRFVSSWPNKLFSMSFLVHRLEPKLVINIIDAVIQKAVENHQHMLASFDVFGRIALKLVMRAMGEGIVEPLAGIKYLEALTGKISIYVSGELMELRKAGDDSIISFLNAELRNGLTVMDPEMRSRYIYPSAFWIGSSKELSEDDKLHLEFIKAAIFAPDIKVSCFATQSLARMLYLNSPWTTEAATDFYKTVKYVDEGDANMAVNLAFLYGEVYKLIDDDSIKQFCRDKLKAFSKSQYARVRMEYAITVDKLEKIGRPLE